MAKKTAKKTTKKATRSTRGRKTSAGGTSRKRASKAGEKNVAQTGPMSLPLLEQLVKLMSANELSNIELQDGQQRIVLSRGGQPAAMPQPPVAPPAQPQPPATPAVPANTAGTTGATGAAEPPAASGPSTAGLVEIKSPMVGTFYASPSPDAKALVQVGDQVTPDTDVCIIEAMKVFNNIKAETSGTIEKLLVENGSAVEYGQPLFLVRPQ